MPNWWYNALERGTAGEFVMGGQDWSKPIEVQGGGGKDNVLDSLREACPRRRFTKDALGKFLARVGVDVKARDTRGNRIWLIPPLPDARKAFADWLDEDLRED